MSLQRWVGSKIRRGHLLTRYLLYFGTHHTLCVSYNLTLFSFLFFSLSLSLSFCTPIHTYYYTHTHVQPTARTYLFTHTHPLYYDWLIRVSKSSELKKNPQKFIGRKSVWRCNGIIRQTVGTWRYRWCIS